MSVKILVVDDNQQKLARLLKVLVEAGINRAAIDVAQTGMDARRLLSAEMYDLMVLDVALPLRPEDAPDRRGGIKLLEELVERDIFNRPLSVVGLTEFDDLFQECTYYFRSKLWTLDFYDASSSGWIDRLKAKAEYVIARAEQQNPARYGLDLCVLAALQTTELGAVRRLPWNWGKAKSLDEVGYYYEGQFTSKDRHRTVVAAGAPRMGMVASAVLSMKMITRFRPRLLVMGGICAGVSGSCSIGDVLVADPAWDWQMGRYSKGGLSIAPDQIDIPTGVAERCVQLAADKKLWFEIHAGFEGDKPANLPTILVGPVTSGSAVLADARLLTEIKRQHRKLLGVEMELYGIYAAARDCSPPSPLAFGMKSVCDFADSKKNDNFQAYAAYVSARAIEAFCERYGSDFLPV